MEKSIEIIRNKIEKSIRNNGITNNETIKWSKLFDKLILINSKLKNYDISIKNNY